MKNKFIKTLSLGIAGIMIFVVISVSIPQNNTVSSNSSTNIFQLQEQDPPSH